MIQLHITFTPVVNETRIFKHSETCLKNKLFKKVIVIGYRQDKSKKNFARSGSQIIRIKLPNTRLAPTRFLRVFNLLYFQLYAIYKAIQVRPACVNIHSVELLPAGWLAKILTGSKLIYDAHELETEKISHGAFERKIAQFIESVFMHSCDLTIVVSKSISHFYYEKYGNLNIQTIRNCRSDEKLNGRSNLKHELKIKSENSLYVYCGALSEGRNIPFLVDYFSSQEKRCIVFIGRGQYEENIRACEGFGRSVFLLGYVEPNEVIEKISGADFGIHLGERKSLSYEYCLPNKFFEYISAELPVVVSKLPEMHNLVKRHNFGITIPLEDLAFLSDHLSLLEKKNYRKLKINVKSAKRHLSWEKEEVQLVQHYKKLFC